LLNQETNGVVCANQLENALNAKNAILNWQMTARSAALKGMPWKWKNHVR